MRFIRVFGLLLFGIFCFLGCDDRTGEGTCVWCPPDTTHDDADVAYGDDAVGDNVAEPDESPPPEDTVVVPTPQEYCSQFVGKFDCTCEQGNCPAPHFYLLSTILESTPTQWTLWVEYLKFDSQWSMTCNPAFPPPTDSISADWTPLTGGGFEYHFQSTIGTEWFTANCLPASK